MAGRSTIRISVVAALALLAAPLSAEPTGRWYGAFGQGAFEYGIKNDSAGSDYFYIYCPQEGAKILITVGGKNPAADSIARVVIGGDEFELPIDSSGEFTTGTHVGNDNFHALWDAMRSGSVMRVRLSTGQSTAFTLKNTAKVLPKKARATAFEQ